MSKLIILCWTILCAVWWWGAYGEKLSQDPDQLSQGAMAGIGIGSIIVFLVWAIGSGAVAAFAIVFQKRTANSELKDKDLTEPRIGSVKATSSPPNDDRKPCPYCAEDIKVAAKICRFCGRDLPDGWSMQGDGSKAKSHFSADPNERIN